MEAYSEILGWGGMTLIVLAYYLLSAKKIRSTSKRYQMMNLLGAIMVGVNVFHQHAWPAFALQCVWGFIALYSLKRARK